MRKLIAAVFGLGAFVAASAYAAQFPGSDASGYEVRTPSSLNESAPADTVASGGESQAVYHPGHMPSASDEINPAGSDLGVTRSDRAGGTVRGSGGYRLFGMTVANAAYPSSVNESAPAETGR